MPKRIIFCADGTWNGPGDGATDQIVEAADAPHAEGDGFTNVLKLFANLAGNVTLESRLLTNEQEKILFDAQGAPEQVAKYLHGVGDSRSEIVKVMGGALGAGLTSRIIRGYTFISRHYDPGDEIHIVGFSRGAYTARALGGMIASVGLLDRGKYDPDDKREAYRRGAAAWSRSKQLCLNHKRPLTQLADVFLKLAQGIHAKTLAANDLVPNVQIRSIAVWDTVGSMGIPLLSPSERMDILQFTDLDLSSKVDFGFHAVAIDERRYDFPVTRWNPRQGVEQVWFAGAHSDVGGGYHSTESGLSDIALEWMMARLGQLGVKFSKPLAYQPKPDPIGCGIHDPSARPPFSLMLKSARDLQATDVLHSSVVDRWNSANVPPYRPHPMSTIPGAPACFTVAT